MNHRGKENPDTLRERVARTIRDAGADAWLVGYDVKSIQELITACGRPVVMRGASDTIARFDEEQRKKRRTVFAGGGRGVALVDSRDAAHALADDLVARFAEVTAHGGVLATAWVPYRRGNGEQEATCIRWLRTQLEMAKDAASTHLPAMPGNRGPVAKCHYCKLFAAHPDRQVHRRDDQSGDVTIENLCVRCHRFYRAGQNNETRRSLEQVARDKRLAAVSADGNNLGALFDELASLEELALVSAAVSAIFQRAQKRALARIEPAVECLALLTGGDDARAFMAPTHVPAYLEELARAVESESASCAQNLDVRSEIVAKVRDIGVGVGVVVGPLYFPAWRLMDHAHELEKRAKRICHDGTARSACDIAILTTEDAILSTPEKRECHGYKPVSLDASEWARTTTRVRKLAQMPGSQLALLGAARALDASEFENALRYQVARSNHWRAWYEACGASWRDPQALISNAPTSSEIALTELFTSTAHRESEARP